MSERDRAWQAVGLEHTPVLALGLPMSLYIRLWAGGLKTVGALDALILDYREGELETVHRLKSQEAREVVSRLLHWCQRRFHEELARTRGVESDRETEPCP
ncbi:MAG: hypothetical protein KGL39_10585 [Patescibacteria group bacterium]|nr:hypothetical protein [Patescibacteria group bacterium]